jgi:hypothetical protein
LTGCCPRVPAGWWPRRPWPWRPRSSRLAAASSRRSTGGSTEAATTPPHDRRVHHRLQDQIDLDTLTSELLTVVDQTMQPSQASLWLRPQARPQCHRRDGGRRTHRRALTGQPVRSFLRPVGGLEPTTFRLRDGCSASDWTAPDGSSLLTLDGPSVQTAPDGYRRIVWMIIGMISASDRKSDAKASNSSCRLELRLGRLVEGPR